MTDIKSSLLSVPGLQNAANGPSTNEEGSSSRSRTNSFSLNGAPRSRSGSFLGPRKKTASVFTLNVNFKRLPEDENGPLKPVYYKMDGERFTEARTLKLETLSKYRVDVNTKPDLDIRMMSIQGNSVTLKRLAKIPNDDDDASDAGAFYEGDWDANLHVTKDGTRQTLMVNIDVENCGTVQHILQCKVYKQSNDHVVWGKPLHAVELECAVKDGEVRIKQDFFR